MKEIMYKQVQLERKLKTPEKVAYSQLLTTYVPSKFANVGKFLKLKNDKNEWEDGWKVLSSSTIEYDEKFITERSRDWTHTREVSDI